MMQKLKLCPFCGGKPYSARWTDGIENLMVGVFQVRCDCGVSGAERYGNEEEAITAWNRRSN